MMVVLGVFLSSYGYSREISFLFSSYFISQSDICAIFLSGFCVLKTYQSPVRCQRFTWDPSNHQLNHNRRNFAPKRTNDLIHANAASEHPLGSQPEAHTRLKSALSAIDAFYRFSRPHTVIGTVK